MPHPYFEMEESRFNRLYFESPRASSFFRLRLVKARHRNLVPLLSGVKPRVWSVCWADHCKMSSGSVGHTRWNLSGVDRFQATARQSGLRLACDLLCKLCTVLVYCIYGHFCFHDGLYIFRDKIFESWIKFFSQSFESWQQQHCVQCATFIFVVKQRPVTSFY